MRQSNTVKTFLFAATVVCALPIAAIAGGSLKDTGVAMDPVSVNWTGVYAGITIGAGMNTVNMVDGYLDEDGYGMTSQKNNSFNFGGTVGYNRQFGNAVLGIESDFSFTNFSETDKIYYSEVGIHSSWDWFSTIRGRLGLTTGATNNVLLYVTGGPAFVGVKHRDEWVVNGENLCGQTTAYVSCVNKTEVGVAFGAGIEAMLGRDWSIKGEYLRLELPTIRTTESSYGYNYKWDDSADIFRVGFNRHF